MCSDRVRQPRVTGGFTLVEMLLAIVVIGIGVAGVLTVFSTTVKNSTDPVVDKQLLAIAEGLMEEIELQPYTSSQTRVVSGCARSGFVRVMDYNDYATSNQICDVEGNTVAALNGYSVGVKVVNLDASTALGGITDAVRITVTASRGTTSLRLVSWRTNFAGS